MRLRWVLLFIIASVLVLVGIPLLLVRPGPPNPEQGGTSHPPPARVTGGRLPVSVYVNSEKRLVTMPLEEYLKGVVAAEMPAEFEMEALKAQAVVARTYTVNRMRALGGPGCEAHPAADVCTDPKMGQAWVSRAEMQRRWGFWGFWRYWRKIARAVESTRGLVVVFGGHPIDAVYHAASGGQTESAEFAWGQPVPYLVSVPSPYEKGRRYERVRVVIKRTDLIRKAGLVLKPAAPPPAVRVLERTPSGRVRSIQVGERVFSGAEFREVFGLNSTLFEVVGAAPDLILDVRGYGHGVGMSQYGADGMAKQGKRYDEIIKHFYSGVEIKPLSELQTR